MISPNLAQEIEKYSLLKIRIDNRAQIQELLDIGLAVDDSPTMDNSIEIIVNRTELNKLVHSNMNFEIIIDNMAVYYDENIKKSPAELRSLQMEMNQRYEIQGFELGSMGGYYTYDQIVSELDSMHLQYPDLITEKSSLGLSLEGRPIWHVKISDNPDLVEGEPQILYDALHHAREPQGMATVIYFMYYLLENYGKDPQVNYLIDNRELYFIPVVNPDGYVYNQTTNPGGGGNWRKNRRLNSDESYGVDLNRNYSFQWGIDDIGSSPDPTSWGYRGTAPFSEPETRAVRDFCESKEIRLCLNYHTYGGILIHPWNYSDILPPDSILYMELASAMTEINNYRYGPGGSSLGYIFNGGTTDWMYGEQSTKNKIIAMTPEVGPSFWPDASQIYPLAEENLQANILLALGNGVINDANSPQIENISSGTNSARAGIDSINISALISNPDVGDITVQTYIEDASKSYLDTIQLFNDGTHGDLLPGDDIFSYRIISPPIEAIFNLYGFLQSNDGQSHFLSAPNNFTTIGPVKLENYIYTSEDTIPHHGTYVSILPLLKNNGKVAGASNISIQVINLDSCNRVGYFSLPGYGNIAPGEVAEPNHEVYVSFGDDCPDSVYTKIKLDILSGTKAFWSDTITFLMHRDPMGFVRGEEINPLTFKLSQNYPNPFNPRTIINYELPITNDVDVSIYNLLGQKVANLISETKIAGRYQVEWDASGFASGVYYYRIETGEYVDVKKMVLIR
jgi:murein tripeptide amidase MpaA